MPRLRLYDCRVSELPATNGLCASDIRSVANLVNRCQRRLLYAKEAGDEGWYGTFAEALFTGVSRTDPFITLSRNVARIEAVTICHHPVPVRNQFFEYLDFGNGRMPRLWPCDNFGVMDTFSRNNAVTFRDLPSTPSKIRIYTTDPADDGSAKRVLLQGFDQNGSRIFSQDGENQVEGEYLFVNTPFTDSVNSFSAPLQGIQKDVTLGTIQFFSVDPVTGDETLIHTMDPGEQVASYRRYYFHNLPFSCCHTAITPSVQTIDIKAILKLELVPVNVDQDYCLLQNLEALIEEAKAIHFSDMEDAGAKSQAAVHHLNAVRLLISELRHYYGKDEPAVNFRPFGSARLNRLNVKMM